MVTLSGTFSGQRFFLQLFSRISRSAIPELFLFFHALKKRARKPPALSPQEAE
jgi:hypothetical protein